MLDVLPVVMVRNEERFIAQVLRPLVAVFGTAIVADTGSTDETVTLARAVGATVYEVGRQDLPGLTQTRKRLGQEVWRRGVPWQFLVDGDELYAESALRQIAQVTLPAGTSCAFTSMLSLDEDLDGAVWELQDQFSRCAIFPADAKWGGTYPFDSPDAFSRPQGFFYYDAPAGLRYHGVHLHRLRRSRRDDEVALRVAKQKQFCLQNLTVPRGARFDLEAWYHA